MRAVRTHACRTGQPRAALKLAIDYLPLTPGGRSLKLKILSVEVLLGMSALRMCVWMCAAIPFILDVRLVDVPAGATQEEGRTEFLHIPSALLALIFIAGNFSRPFPSSTVKSNVVYPRINRSPLVGHNDWFVFL